MDKNEDNKIDQWEQALREHHALLSSPYNYHLNATDKWGLEVLKTLFLLSGAGLAGVFALVQQGPDAIPRDALPFLPFGIGIVTAVFSMILTRYMHDAASDAWFDTINRFADTHDLDIHAPAKTWPIRVLNACAIACGIVSGASSIWAGVALYKLF